MDVKRSAKTKRRSDHVLRDLSKVQKHVLDLQTPVKDKKDNLCVKVLRRKLRKGREGVEKKLLLSPLHEKRNNIKLIERCGQNSV